MKCRKFTGLRANISYTLLIMETSDLLNQRITDRLIRNNYDVKFFKFVNPKTG